MSYTGQYNTGDLNKQEVGQTRLEVVIIQFHLE